MEWNLGDKNTWIHPLTPFSEEYFLQQLEHTEKSEGQSEKPETPAEVEEIKPVEEEKPPLLLPEIPTKLALERAVTEVNINMAVGINNNK